MSFNGDLNATDDGLELTTKGQIHTYSTENTALNLGTDGYILSADSTEATGLKYVANTDAGLTLGTAGDIHVRNASDNVALPITGATTGDLLTCDTTEATKMKWATPAGAGKAYFTTMQDNQSASVDTYYAINSQDFSATSIGSMEMEINADVTLSNLAIHIDYNGKTSNQDFAFLDDGTDIGTITITGSGSGYFDSGVISNAIASGSLIGFIYHFTVSGTTVIRPALAQLDT
jgi:hypothetical protein